MFKFYVRDNKIATVPAALNYKFSAEILCNKNGNSENIIYVTAGDHGDVGSRQFALFVSQEHKIHFAVTNPYFGGKQHASNVECADGSWNTYSVQVRQVEGSPEQLKYVVLIDGNQIAEGTYASNDAYTVGDLEVFFSNWWSAAAATDYHVKNFFYQRFEDCYSDPCDGLQDCQTIINGCEIAPVRNGVLNLFQST